MSAVWNRTAIRRMVMLVEMADGSRSGWEVAHGTLTVMAQTRQGTGFFGDPVKVFDPPRATITAEGYFSGLWLPPENWVGAGFVAGELDPAELENLAWQQKELADEDE